MKQNTKFYDMMLYYFEGHEYLTEINVEMVHASVETLNTDTLDAILAATDMPVPFASKIKKNVFSRSYRSADLYALGDYFNATIVDVILNILSSIILFVIIRFLLGFFLRLSEYSREGFPALKQYDGIIACGFGLIHGVLLVSVLFLLCPLIISILPSADEYITSSVAGGFFYKANLLLTLIPAH